jgi:integrase
MEALMIKGNVILKRNTWHIVLYYTDNEGNRKQKFINTHLPERGNKRTAQNLVNDEIKKLQKALEKNELEKLNKRKSKEYKEKNITFADFLDIFYEKKTHEITQSTLYAYGVYIKQLKEFFKKKKLKDITTEDINAFYTKLRKRNLKDTTIKHYNEVIKPTFKLALKRKLITDNPCDYLPPLKRSNYRAKYYNKAEIELLLEKAKGTKYELIISIAAYYGFRKSEILGLKWDAINFDKKTIAVKHKVIVIKKKVIKSDELKTHASYRTLPLIPQIEKLLLERKQKQQEDIEFFGKDYNLENKDYVTVDEMGRIMRSDNLSTRFRQFLKKHELKLIRFHDLRHSCASLLIANGVSLKQIQEWLGHSNFATTANIYSHLDYSSKIESAQTISNVLNFNTESEESNELEKELVKKVSNNKDLHNNSDNYSYDNKLELLEQLLNQMKKEKIKEKDEAEM